MKKDFRSIYGYSASLSEYTALGDAFMRSFGAAPSAFFCAPGRMEIIGNHTDHQRGRVLAAAANADARAAARLNGSDELRIISEGNGSMSIALSSLDIKESEKGSSAGIVRGLAAHMKKLGAHPLGADIYIRSQVSPGSGLSSSASFEMLTAQVMDSLWGCGLSQPQLAQAGRFAENIYYGKPSGLMDQLTSAVGGMVYIDFSCDPPQYRSIPFAALSNEYSLCVVNAGGSHAGLTEEYAAVTRDMAKVSAFFDKHFLSEVDECAFYAEIRDIRKKTGDRAVLRAMHFFDENRRVPDAVNALETGDTDKAVLLMRESGESSVRLLQNIYPSGGEERSISLALALSKRLLKGKGACRVHGGGFAGTVLSAVPTDMAAAYVKGIEAAFGDGCAVLLSVREAGACEVCLPAASVCPWPK